MVGMSGGRRKWSLLASAAAAAAALLAGSLGGRAAGGMETLALRSVGTFDQPVYITHAPGAGGFLYVVEQGGEVRVVDHGRVLAQPFLSIGGRISCCSERGL